MATPFQVTFDANDTRELARFWAIALTYVPEPPPSGFATWEAWAEEQGIPEELWDKYYALIDPDGEGPRVLFQKVPEGKTAKNRVHLDLRTAPRGTPPEERARLLEERVRTCVTAGGTEVARHDEFGLEWVVMRDPEGNEFCVT